jgi:hypothetical protein
MSWIWTAVMVLVVDQRAGEISNCRQRRAEYRETGGECLVLVMGKM